MTEALAIPPRILPGWSRRLDAFLARHAATPFQWGLHDCCTFAADAVQVLTDRDPLAPWRGTWSSAASAWRALRGIADPSAHDLLPWPGSESAPEWADLLRTAAGRLLGAPVGSSLAQRGDVVLYHSQYPGHEGRAGLGVCVGDRLAAPGDAGLMRAPMAWARCAWRV